MRKSHLALLITATLLIQPAFADEDTKPCADIAKACLNAGYDKNDKAGC